ncbi:cytochrome b5 [Ceratobasidium sp. AG-Ba]|nr:cytochrome b5 [Ceratobasidium sp. AG-Ba]
MSSQLLNWLLAPLVNQPPLKTSTDADSPPNVEISVSEPSPPPSENGHKEDEEDDDAPPPFPLPNSIQRSGGTSTSLIPETTPTPVQITSAPRARSPSPDSKRMPPPPLPTRVASISNNGLIAPPSAITSAQQQKQAPRSTISLPTVGGLALPPSTTAPMPNVNKKGKARAKVALTPGHGALDWANLKSSGADLRGVTELLRVTPSMLKEHRTRDDAWSAFGGKVYNITPYLPYHPGGERELMRVAGRDGTKLFATTHAWVNLDFMLDGCLVGFLVPE